MIATAGRILRERARMNSALLFFGGIFLLSQLSIMAVLHPIGADTVLALQTTFSADAFARQLAELFRAGLVENYLAHYYYDFLHPVWYSAFLALLLARGFERQQVSARRDAWLLLPFVAGACDLVENALHLYMVLDTANIGPLLVGLSATAACIKWLVLLDCAILAAVLLLRRPPALAR